MEIHLLLFLCLGFLFQQELVLGADNVTAYCSDGEEYQMCGACERTCENPLSKEPCTIPCSPGCFCKAGLVRNQQKRCVPPRECNTSTTTCGENEEYLDCGSSCPLTCSNFQESLFCTKHCTKGCFCKTGYVLGPNKKCILPQNCPIGPCHENEVTTDCVNPCNNCAQRGKCSFEFCGRGCDCKHGFHRNSTNHCVEAKDCDVPESLCPKHEHFVPCVSQCNDCWSRGDCDQTFCQPGCDCSPGFFRDDDGECVPESQCIGEEISCGVNEEYTDCVNPCNDCIKQGQCQYNCEYGCDCKKGYFKNTRGICIPAEECEASLDSRNCRSCRERCPVNQQYYICMPTCKTTCDNFNNSMVPCGADCRSGCYCKQGLVRRRDGACILPSECPLNCGLNEEYSVCGPACPESCENFGKSVMCTHQCVKGCFCKRGFIRGPQGTCIQPQLCPAECGENEEYLQCGTACPISCENQVRTSVCSHECVRGCFCRPGFIRGPNGKCINPAFCPVVCGPNEEFQKCGTACPVSCANLTVSQTLPCPSRCVPGCFCKPGFIRGPDGSCIAPTFCPAVCRENEEFQVCGTPCPATCHNHSSPRPCPNFCVRGCICRPGYVKGPNGRCILPQECPVVCKEKEEYMECGPPCPSTCDNIGKSPCAVPCTKGCFCRSGLVRGPDGKCIPPALCPVVCGPNQEFLECGPECPLSCTNYTLPSTHANVNECNRGCFCKTGFVIGPDGSCIPITSCPPICGENEKFQECGTACPVTCDNRLAPQQCTKRCVRGCFCAPGFIRGPYGKCILPQVCPQVCGENEEFKECGTACPLTCTNLTRQDLCPTTCIRGCFCRANFVRDPSGRCVRPQLCPVVCGENEEFKECGTACPPTCTNLTSQRFCPNTCIRGCFCREGFVKDPRGRCVLPQLCPAVCKENEEFQQCGPACPVTCDTISRPTAPCPLPCTSGCFCRQGFLKGPDGRCILPSSCPVRCGENEEFKECGTACPLTCANRTQQGICSTNCVRGCFCRPGFVRDASGRCISPQACPVLCSRNEEFKDCGPGCPITCDTLTHVNVPCSRPCTRGCFCKPGFVRGPDGRCVLPAFCPVVCGGNEEFKECGPACPVTCFNVTAQLPCPLPCIKGCFCREGFVQDPTGKCISPQFCPVVCKRNEEFKECGPTCQVTCDNLGAPSGPCLPRCEKGCFCKPGFVRDRNGDCVLPSLCPVVCGVNEEFRECGSACPANCTNRFDTIVCPAPCVRGCFCRDGFFRDARGNCVRPDLCPVVCKENEIFQECGPSCQHSCENLSRPLSCALQCVKGCFCKPGYVRNREGRCILLAFCPVVCGENEEFQECGTACPATCANPNQQQGCQQICVKGCFCRVGFVRDSTGKCVLPQSCPVVCKENEVLEECGSACPHTCDDLGKPTPPCTLPCLRGCSCKPGYVRNREGNCILPNFCPVVCGENEEFKQCGTACPANCTHPLGQPQCPNLCVKGCFCREGFVRNSEGNCVRPDLCPVVCKENEQFLECGSGCPLTCDNIGTPNIPCTLQCVKGCFCKPGYVRDRTGRCILPNFCPIVCGINEEFQECGTACPANCTNRQEPQRPCSTACVKGCFCRQGFVRGPSGNCVLSDQCPVVCRPNEEFKECGLPCQLTCDNLGIPAPPCPLQCRRGCFCKPGFVRDRDGNCVRPSLCPVSCGENEEFQACGTACPATCTSRTEQRLCPAVCVRGCFCRPGFVRDPTGKCVLPDLCPVVCRENEEFKECGTACPANCTNPLPQSSCPATCVRGCFCRPGFVRDQTGKCVRIDQCPLVCGENEVFQECGTACPANCTTPRPLGPCPTICIRGCFCRPGFIRDPTGRCLRPEQCPLVCGVNEEFRECGTACPANCSNPRPLGPCPANCVRACFCRLGFIRDPTGRCVRPEQCPVVCGENEVFQECGTPCPANCTNPQPQGSCPPVCVRGCFCRIGFLRDSTGRCVRPEQCPLVCGYNEVFQECGSACPANCTNPIPQSPCPPVCVRGCFCRPGFVRDTTGKCIRPEACPAVCGPLEVFKECGSICPANCTHRNPPKLPPNLDTCVRGCFCREGLLRNPDGNCVPPELCPTVCGENEQFEECGTACPPSCSDPIPRRPCPSICVRGCFCRPGFVRDPTGKCVLPGVCPIICQENEEFQQCGSACPITCTNYTNPRPCPLPCNSGCFCRPGFVKGPNGRCIIPNFCPDDCSRPNEEYRECGPPCIRTCGRIDPRQRCDSICVKGCFCKDGFIRDIDGNCILPSECPTEPQKCPPGETFYACVPPCGNTCETLDPEIVRSCNKVCRPGCFCRLGFVKRSDGECVRPNQCPRSFEFRRNNYDDETVSPSVSTLDPTTAEISTQQSELSTDPSTLDTSISDPPSTPLLTTAVTTDTTAVTTESAAVTTEKTAVTTEITTISEMQESQFVSTIQSTTPTTSPEITSLPSTSIGTTNPEDPLRYGFSTPLTTETAAISTAADEAQTVSVSTPSTLASSTGAPTSVTTPPAY